MKLENYLKTKDTKVIENFIKLCKDKNIQFVKDDSLENVIGVGIFVNTNSIDKVNAVVCMITEEASWWNKLNINNYENFIENFDLEEYKKFLIEKLEQTKNKYPEFTIGCRMISTIDLEYGFFKNKYWTPYILEGYIYSSVKKTGVQKHKRDMVILMDKLWDKNMLQ